MIDRLLFYCGRCLPVDQGYHLFKPRFQGLGRNLFEKEMNRHLFATISEK